MRTGSLKKTPIRWASGRLPTCVTTAVIFLLQAICLNGQIVIRSDLSGNLQSLASASNSAPNIISQPLSAVAAVANDVSFSVVAAGSPPLFYQWQLNSNNISGATGDSLLLTNIGPGDFGVYRLLVSNSLGSAISSNALLQLDSDRDGLADSWETNFFGNITNYTGSDDYDLDGVANVDEFREGTNPKFFNSANPRLTIVSDFGQVMVTPNTALYTNNEIITLTGIPNPGLQFLGYIGNPTSGGPYYGMRTNPATLHFGTPGINGGQTIRAIFGLPLNDALDVTNGWRIDQAGWYGQTNITHDGVSAAQSARILGDAEALLQLTNVVLKTEGTITFWWKVDGTDQDILQFRRNNLPRSGAIGTNTDWQFRTYYLTAGTNIVEWDYVKRSDQVSEYNGLTYAPADAGWVDQVSYAPWPDPTLDSDGDGLPDIWEYKYFDSLAGGPNDDPDGDGISNHDEFLDGTDPSSNASFLPRLYVSASGGIITRNPDLPKYTLGQVVQLQAVPDPTNYLVTWTGAVTGTNLTNSIFMNGNKTISAIFGLPLPFALNTPSMIWTRDNSLSFFGETNVSHDAIAAAQSGPVAFHQESAMQTSVTGPGTLIFWWKAACTTNINFGRFVVDGIEQSNKITGAVDWLPQNYLLPAGTHTLRWTYTNNTAAVSLTNCIWVDQVSFTPQTVAPAIVGQPSDLLIAQGQKAVFTVEVTGTPPFNFQWFRNNASLGAVGTNAILTLTNVSPADSGNFTVQVGNPVQTIMSQPAKLTVVPVPPVNDNFANRTPLTGTNAVLGYTTGATRETGEPDHAFTFGYHSVWWTWTAPANGNFSLNVIETNVTSSLLAAIYTGGVLTNLTPVQSAIGTQFSTNGQNLSLVSLMFQAVAGTSYAIALDQNGSDMGFFSLSVTPVAKPVLGGTVIGGSGEFSLECPAIPGAHYTIEASNDLQFWTTVATGIVPPSGQINFSDPLILGIPSRFYRVNLQ